MRQGADERGFTLPELLMVVAIVFAMAAVAAPSLRAYAAEAHILGAARTFKGHFLRARSMAVRGNVQTAIRFEHGADGFDYYSIYVDGNRNGVLSQDIRSGRDKRVEGPYRLDAGLSGVRVAINRKVPAIPPERGTLSTTDPIRFGRSNMLSFSPFGTATPGTFYLAGEWAQAAVRVNPETARVRLMVYHGVKWVER